MLVLIESRSKSSLRIVNQLLNTLVRLTHCTVCVTRQQLVECDKTEVYSRQTRSLEPAVISKHQQSIQPLSACAYVLPISRARCGKESFLTTISCLARRRDLRGQHQPVRIDLLEKKHVTIDAQLAALNPGQHPPDLLASPPLYYCLHRLHCYHNMGKLEPSGDGMSLQSPQHPLGTSRAHLLVANIGTGAATGCRNDYTLEPFVSGCRGDFDFTILFELVVLSILPAVCFLVISSHRIWRLRSRPVVIRGSLLSLSKLVSGCNYPTS